MSVQLTNAARGRISHLLTTNNAKGMRVRLRTRGCSGLSYVMEYVNEPLDGDDKIPLGGEIIEHGHMSMENQWLFIQGSALLFLVGTEMDYEETPLRKGFTFRNPHEKGRCGCGTSFHV